MTTTLKIGASHVFIYVDSLEIDLAIRHLNKHYSLREFFRSLIEIEEKYDKKAVDLDYDWDDMLEEIPVRASFTSLKYRNKVYCLTLGEDSYAPWEVIMALDSIHGKVYVSYDEPTEECCRVYDPEYRTYPKEGYLLHVVGYGKEIHSFVRTADDINTAFYNTYHSILTPTGNTALMMQELSTMHGMEEVSLKKLIR